MKTTVATSIFLITALIAVNVQVFGAEASQVDASNPSITFADKVQEVTSEISVSQLESQFKKGTKVSTDMFPKPQPVMSWFWMPKWTTGMWNTDSIEVVFPKQETTKTSLKISVGDQEDNLGEIWKAVALPTIFKTDLENGHHNYRINYHQTAQGSSRFLKKIIENLVVMVDDSGEIELTAREVFTVIFTPSGPDEIKARSVTTLTEPEDTTPFSERREAYTLSKVSPYQRNDYLDSNDFRKLPLDRDRDTRAGFRQFLSSHGLSNLLPKTDADKDRPSMGIRFEIMDKQKAHLLGVGQNSVTITKVEPDGSAAKAGVREGDIIEEIDSIKIDGVAHVVELLRKRKVGDTMSLKIFRDYQQISIPVKLGSYQYRPLK